VLAGLALDLAGFVVSLGDGGLEATGLGGDEEERKIGAV